MLFERLLQKVSAIEPTPGIPEEGVYFDKAPEESTLYGRGNPYSSLSGFLGDNPDVWGQKAPYVVKERNLSVDPSHRAKRALIGGSAGAWIGGLLAGPPLALSFAKGVDPELASVIRRSAARRALALLTAGGAIGALIPRMRVTRYSGPDQAEAEAIYQNIYRRRAGSNT